jgi:hypothetical protein
VGHCRIGLAATRIWRPLVFESHRLFGDQLVAILDGVGGLRLLSRTKSDRTPLRRPLPLG